MIRKQERERGGREMEKEWECELEKEEMEREKDLFSFIRSTNLPPISPNDTRQVKMEGPIFSSSGEWSMSSVVSITRTAM